MGSCGNCHYLKQFLRREKDFSNMVFESKRENINFENIEIICPSQWLATLASRSNLLKKSKIHVLPNPIDIDTYKKLDKKQCCRDLGLDPGKAYLLFVAANVGNYYKGISILYQALELLKTKYLSSDDIEFLIVGANKSSPIEIQGYVVHNLGYISDEATMVKIYNAADTFVTPSLEENLPNTIMEALACGVPCVGFDTGGIKELIEHKSCGYVAKYKNVEDLVNGLIYCFEDKGRLQQLSFNAQKKASESYSYEVISAKLENLYKQALINRGYN
jgi:glycosyltransferase involved in cell wall biosynthesis